MADVEFDIDEAFFGTFDGLGDITGTFDLDFDEDLQRTEVYEKPHLRRAQAVTYDNAIDMCRGMHLCEGYRMFAFVSGNFVFGDLLEAMTVTRRWDIDRITIQTLSLNKYNIDSIANMVEMNHIREVRLVVSYYWWANYVSAKKGDVSLVNYLHDTLAPMTDLHVAVMRTHSKVVSVLTKNGGKVVIHGSANLRSSDNVEQVCVECDPELYDFVEAFADRAIAEYDVVRSAGGKTVGSDV